MITSYTLYSDPGHGWLRVNIKELYNLNIEQDISNYSYISKDKQYVFLEEDCDAECFYNAKEKAGEWPLKIHYKHTDNRSKIRSYNHYIRPIKW